MSESDDNPYELEQNYFEPSKKADKLFKKRLNHMYSKNILKPIAPKLSSSKISILMQNVIEEESSPFLSPESKHDLEEIPEVAEPPRVHTFDKTFQTKMMNPQY